MDTVEPARLVVHDPGHDCIGTMLERAEPTGVRNLEHQGTGRASVRLYATLFCMSVQSRTQDAAGWWELGQRSQRSRGLVPPCPTRSIGSRGPGEDPPAFPRVVHAPVQDDRPDPLRVPDVGERIGVDDHPVRSTINVSRGERLDPRGTSRMTRRSSGWIPRRGESPRDECGGGRVLPK